jgi:hypothetical protein
MNNLESKYTVRAMARAKLEQTARALERARRIEATAAGHVRTLEQRVAQAEIGQAVQLVELIAGGNNRFLPCHLTTRQRLTDARVRFTLRRPIRIIGRRRVWMLKPQKCDTGHAPVILENLPQRLRTRHETEFKAR